MKVLVTQSCLILRYPMDCSLPGASVHGILQARILEWVAFPSLGHLPDPELQPGSPALQAHSLPSESPGKPKKKPKKLKRTFKKREQQQDKKEEKQTSLAQQVKDRKSPEIKELT